MESNNYKVNFVLSQNSIASMYQKFREDKKLTDVKVKVGNKEIGAHKIILEEASPVIKTMFEPHWFNENVLEFEKENIDPDILEDLLDVFYSIPIDIRTQNAFSLCIASNFLDIPGLLKECEQFLSNNVSNENVVNFYISATNLELEKLKKSCTHFIINKNKNIPEDHKLWTLDFDKIRKILHIMIGENDLKNISEEGMFNFIVSCAENDLQSCEVFHSKFFELFDSSLMEDTLKFYLVNNFFYFQNFSKKLQKKFVMRQKFLIPEYIS